MPESTMAMPQDTGRVRCVVADDVATLTFDRPAARNAMTWAMYEQLAQACETIAADREVRVAVLCGVDASAFVSGTDIAQFESFRDGHDGVRYERQVDDIVGALERLRVPTIAVVRGFAIGAGLILANACDVRLATPGARFGAPIARTVGNCLSMANLHRLRQNLGAGLLRRMLVLGEMPRAEALPAGYVQVVDESRLDETLTTLCDRLRGHAPLTIAATKDALLRLDAAVDRRDDDIIARVYGSPDFREGVRSFTGKRPADWPSRAPDY